MFSPWCRRVSHVTSQLSRLHVHPDAILASHHDLWNHLQRASFIHSQLEAEGEYATVQQDTVETESKVWYLIWHFIQRNFNRSKAMSSRRGTEWPLFDGSNDGSRKWRHIWRHCACAACYDVISGLVLYYDVIFGHVMTSLMTSQRKT